MAESSPRRPTMKVYEEGDDTVVVTLFIDNVLPDRKNKKLIKNGDLLVGIHHRLFVVDATVRDKKGEEEKWHLKVRDLKGEIVSNKSTYFVQKDEVVLKLHKKVPVTWKPMRDGIGNTRDEKKEKSDPKGPALVQWSAEQTTEGLTQGTVQESARREGATAQEVTKEQDRRVEQNRAEVQSVTVDLNELELEMKE